MLEIVTVLYSGVESKGKEGKGVWGKSTVSGAVLVDIETYAYLMFYQ